MQLSVLFIKSSTHFRKLSPKLKRLKDQTMDSYSFDMVSNADLQSKANKIPGFPVPFALIKFIERRQKMRHKHWHKARALTSKAYTSA